MGQCRKKMRISKNNNNKKKNQIEEGEDRLSILPDCILVTILNLLPIDSAAVTSVLSHRWQYLWTQRESFFFPPIEKSDKYKNFEYFNTTVDHIISKLTFFKIKRFNLEIPCVDNPKSSDFMFPWFSKICLLMPKTIVLKLKFIRGIRYNIRLPPCLLQTQSLFALSLSALHKFEFMMPVDGIKLPNLKVLHLDLHNSQLSLLGAFSKSCPLLEALYVVCRKRDNGNYVGEIISPNLKFLCIACLGWESKFVIAASKLEIIHFMGHLPFIHFVNNPIWLQKLSLDVMLVQRNDGDYSRKVQDLCRSISCVTSLDLGKFVPCPRSCLLSTLNGITPPIFLTIIHLSLNSNNIDGSSQIPLGFLCKLKTVELSEVDGNELELKFLEHMLSNAPVLEHLCVSFCEVGFDGRESECDQSGIEYKFCTDLFLLHKSSLGCKINFSGKRITASSDDFRNGVLIGQTVN